MRRVPLFEIPDRNSGTTNGREPIDDRWKCLLRLYRQRRYQEECDDDTMDKEISQLRSLARLAYRKDFTPETVFRHPRLLANVLLHPSAAIVKPTGRARLIAAQRFIRLCGAEFGIQDPDSFLDSLQAELPSQGDSQWHNDGTIVAGGKSRKRSQNPTLMPSHLNLIVNSGFPRSTYRHARNRALLAAHCFTGLRPEEIVQLTTTQLLQVAGSRLTYAEIWRNGTLLRLPIIEDAMFHIRAHLASQSQEGYIFTRGRNDPKPLTVRATRNIVKEACFNVGLPAMTATDLRSAFAFLLKGRALSDHEVASVLGLRQVRTVDRLSARHLELKAQRHVHEVLTNIKGNPRHRLWVICGLES